MPIVGSENAWVLKCKAKLPRIIGVYWIAFQLQISVREHYSLTRCTKLILQQADIRKRCIIHSSAGNAMIIPRERRLVRFYVELCRRPDEDEKYGAEDILGKIVEILKPYHFSTQIVEWESTYSVSWMRWNQDQSPFQVSI